MSSIIHEKLEILDIQYFYGLYGELGKGSMRYLFSALNMFLILLLSRIFNTSTVLTMHSVINDISKESIIDEIKSRNYLNFFLRLFNSMVGFFTDKVVVLSAFQFEEIRKYVNSSKIQMIPHGFDHKKPLEKKEHSGFTFLFFGLIRPNKGVLDLLISFDLLSNKYNSIKLIIMGGLDHSSFKEYERYYTKVRKCVESMQSSGKIIEFREGWIDESVLTNALTVTDAIVLPYVDNANEVSGVASQLAYAGIPFILSEIPRFNSIFLDNFDCLFFPPKNTTVLAKKMEQIMINPNLRRRLGENLINKSVKFNWSYNAMEYAKIYQSLKNINIK